MSTLSDFSVGTPKHTSESDLVCTWGENDHMRWEFPHGVKMPTWDENVHVRWTCPHMVRMFMLGDFSDGGGDTPNIPQNVILHVVKWKGPYEVRISTWGENAHMRLEWPCEVNMPTHGENVHARWLFRWWRRHPKHTSECDLACSEVKMAIWGENFHMGWKCPHEIGMTMWGEHAHTWWECSC